MTVTVIKNATIVEPGRRLHSGNVLIRDGKIAGVSSTCPAIWDVHESVDARGALLTPGLIDLHCHGIGRHLFEIGAEHIRAANALLPRFGTTSVLPTLYTVMTRSSLNHLETLADELNNAANTTMVGFHLEGPFLALAGAGAATLAGDVGLLKEILAAAKGRVTAMSVSPETPNIIPVIEYLCDERIVVFMTHTRASVEQAEAAIAAGARHATHFYDVFPPPPETDPGVRPAGAVEAILADRGCTVDFICDGVHVHPKAIEAAMEAKGWRGIVAITDANVGAGLPSGIYDTPWGYRIAVSPQDAARIADDDHPQCGQLAGSSLTMAGAVANLLKWFNWPRIQVWAMATKNPATVARLHNKGDIQVGHDADLVLWSSAPETLQPLMTWVAGACVFDAEQELCFC